jgi:hypothetical protein
MSNTLDMLDNLDDTFSVPAWGTDGATPAGRPRKKSKKVQKWRKANKVARKARRLNRSRR